jgi:molybdopterin-guanine dinucleotide biosynthesis protein A
MANVTNTVTVGGIILCGGRSTRMGTPKALLPLGDDTMLTRIARILAEVVQPLRIVTAVGQELPDTVDPATVVRDELPERGPLQGIATGLASMPAEVDAVFVASCDIPLLRPAFVRRLIELLGDHQACVAKTGDHLHPLVAVYRVSVLPVVRELLQEDRLRPTLLFARVTTCIVSEDELRDVDPKLDSLRNVNTPEEYAQVMRDLLL